MAAAGPHIVIVMPLFCPDIDVIDNARTAAAQASVIAVDDGSDPTFDDTLEQIEAAGCRVIRLDSNQGIAKALNTGIAAALRDGADQVITLDQDSRMSDAMVEMLSSSFVDSGIDGSVAAVGPGHLEGTGSEGTIRYAGKPGPRPGLIAVTEALQSGLLMPATALQALGGFDESLVIDGVDTEFCLRARRQGYQVLVDTRVRMHHRIGAGANARQFRAASWRPIATGHSARRRYYITRNRIRLLFRYGPREPKWAAVYVRRLVVSSVLAVTVEPDRIAKLLAILTGVRDAVLRRSGRTR